jgi:hypothetical protein
MVRIVGLTDGKYKTPCPVGKKWLSTDVKKFQKENYGFNLADGSLTKPYEDDPFMLRHGSTWYWISGSFHPVFDEHYTYIGYRVGGIYYEVSNG